MKVIRFLDKHVEEIILVFLLSATSVLTFLQVVMRYVAKSPLSWSEEASRYMFIWMIYIGVSYGVKQGRHIKVDFIMGLFPAPIKNAILIISDLIFMGFSLYIIVAGSGIASKILSLGQRSPAMGVQMGYIYLATVIGFSLTFIRLLQNFIIRLKKADDSVILSGGGEK